MSSVSQGDDGLFLGLGDFLVFSVFSAHAARGGLAPLAVVAVGLLVGMVLTMLHVSLKWPQRALEPVLPLSVLFAAVLLAAERGAVRMAAEALAAACVTV